MFVLVLIAFLVISVYYYWSLVCSSISTTFPMISYCIAHAPRVLNAIIGLSFVFFAFVYVCISRRSAFYRGSLMIVALALCGVFVLPPSSNNSDLPFRVSGAVSVAHTTCTLVLCFFAAIMLLDVTRITPVSCLLLSAYTITVCLFIAVSGINCGCSGDIGSIVGFLEYTSLLLLLGGLFYAETGSLALQIVIVLMLLGLWAAVFLSQGPSKHCVPDDASGLEVLQAKPFPNVGHLDVSVLKLGRSARVVHGFVRKMRNCLLTDTMLTDEEKLKLLDLIKSSHTRLNTTSFVCV
jgi:hypothetical protein